MENEWACDHTYHVHLLEYIEGCHRQKEKKGIQRNISEAAWERKIN